MINFPGGTSEKITDQLDDVIKGNPGKLIVHVRTNDISDNVNLLKNVKKIFRKQQDNNYTTSIFCDNR